MIRHDGARDDDHRLRSGLDEDVIKMLDRVAHSNVTVRILDQDYATEYHARQKKLEFLKKFYHRCPESKEISPFDFPKYRGNILQSKGGT